MVMPHRRFLRTGTDETPDLVKLWVLRLLVPLGGSRKFIKQFGIQGDALADILGLHDWDGDSATEYRKAHAHLRQAHLAAEQELRAATSPEELSWNVAQLARLLDLSPTDCKVLEFAVFLHSEPLLAEAADLLGALPSAKAFRVVSVVLDIPESEIRCALSGQGGLARSGLVLLNRHGASSLWQKLEVLSESFVDLILTSEADPVALLRDRVAPCGAPELAIGDYGHIDRSLAILRPYLRGALQTKQRGVNIFVYGPPGTGKTQLARVIAAELGCELFQITSENAEGDPVAGERRLCAFRAAQSFLAQSRALILFDEVEDVFDDGKDFFGRKSTGQLRKGWMNRMLGENPVPTLWLSNSVSCLDPAFVRRFDMVIELPVPPRRQRERIVRAACQGLLPERSVRRIAEAETLAPAVIARAASVVRAVRDELPAGEVPKAIEHLISSTLEAQGYRPLDREGAYRLPDFYDAAFVNASADLSAIADGIASSRSARLCLYGPSGTGKTAFGRWLADRLGVPLHARRASDLISMWVGETERNISRAFRDAEEDSALLLVDEVDSFLQDRRGAQRSWEVTAVNEMLTQMESFAGVFVASTNLMTGLDQASLRRFDLKVKFGYLEAEQAWRLLLRQCEALAIAPPLEALNARISRLAVLTPGDFAAVARQHRFRGIASADAFVGALEQECAMKEGGHQGAIGFL